ATDDEVRQRGDPGGADQRRGRPPLLGPRTWLAGRFRRSASISAFSTVSTTAATARALRARGLSFCLPITVAYPPSARRRRSAAPAAGGELGVQAVDQREVGDGEEPGQRRAGGRGAGGHNAQGGVNGSPSVSRACPPTGMQHSSRNGASPAFPSSNGTSTGTTT